MYRSGIFAVAAVGAGLGCLLGSTANAQKSGKDAPALTPLQIIEQAADDHWRPVELGNLLIIELPAGPVAIEMRPDFAPLHVERIKTLVRQKFYDGLNFHRVIEGFVAQGGDPKGDGTGGSDLPNIPPEFVRDSSAVSNFTPIGRDRIAARVGFVDGMPVAAQPETLRSFRESRSVEMWGAHCPGVMSMARASAPDSANSQFFLMIGDARLNLDRRYSTWGWIVDGFENTRRINRGEPPQRPTPIVRVRLAVDLPEAEQPKIEVFSTASPIFQTYLKAAGYVDDTGLVRDLCTVKAPRRVSGKIEL